MNTVKITLDLPTDRLADLQKFLEGKPSAPAAVKKPAKKEEPVPVPEAPAAITPSTKSDEGNGTGEQSAVENRGETKVDKSMLRAKGVEITKAGKQAELREIFKKFGATNLSSLAEEHYAEAYKLMEELI